MQSLDRNVVLSPMSPHFQAHSQKHPSNTRAQTPQFTPTMLAGSKSKRYEISIAAPQA
jgi:hypothetical protein